jgi:hypothetical protein
MTYKELQTKLKTENHIIPSNVQISLGKLQEADLGGEIWGIYEKGGVWYLYSSIDVGDDIETFQVDHGSEESIADAMYRNILRLENEYMERLSQGIPGYQA